ncbi:two-component system, NtrC family, response regulator [Candidatus Thermokryptus mobilis]|uniref:Two-component system, NtrC family, response regulator n=1 Tax=Candidatus Thermokryptus mobilis TaxID=1643428 RepID=A0A0S4N3N9_9BACT|nr:sigma-54 dependent transcriptional regulator [Candidatus Thermokryptus mobilis]CUU04751.1 two-component system, NtrC family, response regulator [Candidatus Thermokryptus mobilis]
MKVFIIEDEYIKLVTLSEFLKRYGYEVFPFGDPIEAMRKLENEKPDVVVTDIIMPGMDGFEVLEKVKQCFPRIYVIMITAYGSIDSAIKAMKMGAYDYITKPFKSEDLLLRLEKIKELEELKRENESLRRQLKEQYRFTNIVGRSKKMSEVFDKIEVFSNSDYNVVIEGESGTGKDLIARAIHNSSARKEKPFVKISCVSLPETLLESELFGSVKGAYTGAVDRKGRFEIADGGTIFLDDIDDMPLNLQAKLLRFLDTKEFERVGSSQTIKVDVRVICATKIDLWSKVQEGKFRDDLYYRLNVLKIKVPPLRERKEDIPLLVEHFLKIAGRDNVKFTSEAMQVLISYDWPGNVRQLENTIYRICTLLDKDIVDVSDIPDDILGFERTKISLDGQGVGINFDDLSRIGLDELLSKIEFEAIKWALKRTENNKTKAADLLGLKKSTFFERLKKYNLD